MLMEGWFFHLLLMALRPVLQHRRHSSHSSRDLHSLLLLISNLLLCILLMMEMCSFLISLRRGLDTQLFHVFRVALNSLTYKLSNALLVVRFGALTARRRRET